MKINIFNVTGILSPSNEQMHISYSFYIKDITNLRFSFDYNPKQLNNEQEAKAIITKCLNKYTEISQEEIEDSWEQYLPIKNLLTISVDDPYMFRGAAHRQPSNNVICIEEQKATEGFVKGKIVDGYWKITISTHAIVTESCVYKLEVWTESCDE
ncbi:hypothetical protein AN639_07845 [Candidatus Epulonipiscium fishelsonii]|uniref:Uncharacterized protein n=1 Tax=Candidatus Epulonipiscium fishelsonii TaxID=77094 RepID=A0ACC8X8I0_9FIRM|nr:hypothetical protein AN396_11035 [Epulopiscium sp. SCG-B11WGA-EpuloA1]ONI38408.1 hypothetical protein AN639_07845 [Epulopiscium sp. SCG-B05WGA-EpuloA1]